MFAVESVELGVVEGAVLGAKPPAPVAALGGKQRFLCLLQSCFGRSVAAVMGDGFLGALVSFPRVPEKLPCSNVFGVADPEIGRASCRERGSISGGAGVACCKVCSMKTWDTRVV